MSRNVHASLELVSLMCMLKSPSIILFVVVDSRVIRWSVTSSMNILFVIAFLGWVVDSCNSYIVLFHG